MYWYCKEKLDVTYKSMPMFVNEKYIINDWATLPSALKKLMPKTIFKYKLKQFLLNHF